MSIGTRVPFDTVAITQETVVLNNPADWSSLERRERTTSTGTHVRYSVTVSCEPVAIAFGELTKMEATATAIVGVLRAKIQAITATVTKATRRKREMMANATASPRYTGGRTGYKPPGAASLDRLFNDSGRLAEGLFARRNSQEDGFTINVPANRLDASTFGGGEPALLLMWQRLVTLVPEFKGGQDLFGKPEVWDAVHADVASAIVVANAAGRARLSAARLQFATQLLRDAAKVFTLGG